MVSRRARQVLRLPGVRSLILGTILGRLAYGMLPVAVYLLLLRSTGQIGTAASLTAAQGLVGAVLFPRKGRLVDRRGRPALTLMGAAAFVLLVAAGLVSQQRAGTPVVFVALVLVALVSPPVTSTSRAAWGRILAAHDDLRDTAFALDSGLEEATFLAGPALAGVAAAGLGTGPVLWVVAALFGGAAALLVRLVRPASSMAPRSRSRLSSSTHLIGALLGVDALAQGLVAAGIAAAATGLHSPTLYGVLLSLDGVGALLGVGLVAYLGRDLQGANRVRLLCLAGPILTVPLVFSHSVVPLLFSVALLGLPVAALAAALNASVPKLEREDRWNEAFSWLVTLQNLAGAAGFAAGGLLASTLGQSGPVLVGIGVAAVGYGFLAPAVSRRLDR